MIEKLEGKFGGWGSRTILELFGSKSLIRYSLISYRPRAEGGHSLSPILSRKWGE
jgi:hypothetical protein